MENGLDAGRHITVTLPDTGTLPEWMTIARQVIVFMLGVALICYAVVSSGTNFGPFAAGLILVGMVPVEQLFARRNHKT